MSILVQEHAHEHCSFKKSHGQYPLLTPGHNYDTHGIQMLALVYGCIVHFKLMVVTIRPSDTVVVINTQ